MCQFKSAIILKDRVFIPDYDSHSNMLKELGIADTKENAERLFIRAELIPVDDVFSDISTWKFNVDQDILPDWYVEEYDKQRMIEAVKEWAKDRIHIGKDNLDIFDGAEHYIKNCTNVKIHGSAQVEKICGDTKVKNIYNNATVYRICNNATVNYIYGNATVYRIFENVTVKNICNNATVNSIDGSVKVDSIYGNATVDSIYDSATVNSICGNARVDSIYGNATIITSQCQEWAEINKTKISDNAIIKDTLAHTIYNAGGWKLKTVGELQG